MFLHLHKYVIRLDLRLSLKIRSLTALLCLADENITAWATAPSCLFPVFRVSRVETLEAEISWQSVPENKRAWLGFRADGVFITG